MLFEPNYKIETNQFLSKWLNLILQKKTALDLLKGFSRYIVFSISLITKKFKMSYWFLSFGKTKFSPLLRFRNAEGECRSWKANAGKPNPIFSWPTNPSTFMPPNATFWNLDYHSKRLKDLRFWIACKNIQDFFQFSLLSGWKNWLGIFSWSNLFSGL